MENHKAIMPTKEELKQISLSNLFPVGNDTKMNQIMKNWQNAIDKNKYDPNVYLSQDMINIWKVDNFPSYVKGIKAFFNSYIPTYIGMKTKKEAALAGFLVNLKSYTFNNNVLSINQLRQKQNNLDPLSKIIDDFDNAKFCSIMTFDSNGDQIIAKEMENILIKTNERLIKEKVSNDELKNRMLVLMNQMLITRFKEYSTIRGFIENSWSGGSFSLLCKNELLCNTLINNYPLFSIWGKNVRFYKNKEDTILVPKLFTNIFPNITQVLKKYLNKFE